MDMLKQKWLALRIRLAGWIYTAPPPVVPNHWKKLDIPYRAEAQLRALLLLPHDADIEVVASSTEDRHLAAARAGFTYPPPKLREINFKSGAKMLDYSMPDRVDRDESWPPEGDDPLAGVADDLSGVAGFATPPEPESLE